VQGSKMSARRQFHLTDWLTCTPPTPCFCVCAGMIGLMGAFRGCAGIIGLSMRKSEGEAKDEGVGRSKMAQEQLTLSITRQG
jgi:hypothetical protein